MMKDGRSRAPRDGTAMRDVLREQPVPVPHPSWRYMKAEKKEPPITAEEFWRRIG